MVDLHKMKDGKLRFDKMCAEIRSLLEKVNPDLVVIEDVMLMKSPQTTKLLAQLQGIIIGFCQMQNKPYKIYLPTAWRKLLGFKQGRIKREELKAQAIDLILEKFEINANSDEADAICIAMAYFIDNLEEI